MLKGFFYRRSPEGPTSKAEVNIRFEINSKESVLAKTTNLSPEGMQFILPRGKVILVPDEKILLILNHPEHGEFKIQSEVYYFCNTLNQKGDPVVCYGVMFIELSPTTWEMLHDFCGSGLPEITYAPFVSQTTVGAALQSTPAKVSSAATGKLNIPPTSVFTQIPPVTVPITPLPVLPEATPQPQVFSIDPSEAIQPALAEETGAAPKNRLQDTGFNLPPLKSVPELLENQPVTTAINEQQRGPAKKPATVTKRTASAQMAAVTKEKPATPVQNSIQALAASLAIPPAPQKNFQAQSLSQEMIDRLIEKLQAEAAGETKSSSEPVPDATALGNNPVLEQPLNTEIKPDPGNSASAEIQRNPTARGGIEYLLQDTETEDQANAPYTNFLINYDPFAKTDNTGQDLTNDFSTIANQVPPVQPQASGSEMNLKAKPLFGDTASPKSDNVTTIPPLMGGTSLADIIMDMDAPALTPGTAEDQPFQPGTGQTGLSFNQSLGKTKTNPAPQPVLPPEELKSDKNIGNPQKAIVHAVTPKVKPVSKTPQGRSVIPPLAPGSLGVSMDQKAIDKLVQSLLQEENRSETAPVTEKAEPAATTPGHTVTLGGGKKNTTSNNNSYQQSLTSFNAHNTNEQPLKKKQPEEVKTFPDNQLPYDASNRQPGKYQELKKIFPDPNSTRVMDQKSIDLIVQTLTQQGDQTKSRATVPTRSAATDNRKVIKLNTPEENRRTLDQKAIDQVVQALIQNHAPQSVASSGTVSGATKPIPKNYPPLTEKPVTPFPRKEQRNTFSLASLSASLQLENGPVLQCSIEQIYVGGIMVDIDKELPLNSAIRISIFGEGIRITDLQGTCTNCEPKGPGKTRFSAEIFFKNLSTTHMEQFRNLIAKL